MGSCRLGVGQNSHGEASHSEILVRDRGWACRLDGFYRRWPGSGGCCGGRLLGWLAAAQIWVEAGKAVRPVSKAYASVPAVIGLFATFGFMLALVTLGASVSA